MVSVSVENELLPCYVGGVQRSSSAAPSDAYGPRAFVE
jgi:hypothetical protein